MAVVINGAIGKVANKTKNRVKKEMRLENEFIVFS